MRARQAAARVKRNGVGTENQDEKPKVPNVVTAPVQEAIPSYAAVLSGEDKTKSCSPSKNHSGSICMEVSGNSSGGRQFADRYDTVISPTNKLQLKGKYE